MAVSAERAHAGTGSTPTAFTHYGAKMNTKRKPVHVIQCEQCSNTFLTVGNTDIGMAYPRRVHNKYNEFLGVMVPMTGVCPAHRRKLVDQ
jgi:hypothetical protein